MRYTLVNGPMNNAERIATQGVEYSFVSARLKGINSVTIFNGREKRMLFVIRLSLELCLKTTFLIYVGLAFDALIYAIFASDISYTPPK